MTKSDVDNSITKYRIAFILIVVIAVSSAILFSDKIGKGERLGVVVYTRKVSRPWKATYVWMRYYYTDGIMNEESFVREYEGWHDFELGKLYLIKYNRHWTHRYPEITSIEVIET